MTGTVTCEHCGKGWVGLQGEFFVHLCRDTTADIPPVRRQHRIEYPEPFEGDTSYWTQPYLITTPIQHAPDTSYWTQPYPRERDAPWTGEERVTLRYRYP